MFIYSFIYLFIYLFIYYIFSLLLYWGSVCRHILRVICYFYYLHYYCYYYYCYWYYYYYYYNYCYYYCCYYCYLYFWVIFIYSYTEPLQVFTHLLVPLYLSLGLYCFNWFVTIWQLSLFLKNIVSIILELCFLFIY